MAAGRLSRRTSAALAGLALAVLTLHGLVLDEMADQLAAWREVRPMPPRLTAAFMRTLKPSTPPPRPAGQVPAPARPPAHDTGQTAAQTAAASASAPEPAASAAAKIGRASCRERVSSPV